MKISHLPKGTKLMWDPGSNYPDTKIPIINAITVGERHPDWGKKPFNMVKIHFGSRSHWMGPEEQYIRKPTDEELKEWTWVKFPE